MIQLRAHLYAALVALLPLATGDAARADEWGSIATISAEPTAGYVCYANANGKDVICNSTAPYIDATTGNAGIGTASPATKLAVVGGADTWAANFYGLSNSDTVRLGTLSGIATIGANNNAGSAWANLAINPGGNIIMSESSGNVGIGASSPGHKLHVAETKTDTAIGWKIANHTRLDAIPAATSSATFIAAHNLVDYSSSQNGTSSIGAINQGYFSGSGTLDAAYGTYNQAINNSTGTITYARGALNEALNLNTGGAIADSMGAVNISANQRATGTMTSMQGSYNSAENRSTGAVTHATGSRNMIYNTSTGEIGNAYSIVSGIENTGTIWNAYSYYVGYNNSGTLANWYGLFIPAINGNAPTTARHPVYVADTGINYFAGSVGIGTSAPTADWKVDVAGSGSSGILVQGDVGTLGLRISAAGPRYLEFHNSAASSGSKFWRMTNNGGALSFEKVNDAYTISTEYMSISSAGTLTVGLVGTTTGKLALAGATSGNVTFQAAAAAGSATYTLPSADGSSGYQLTTNGSGTLSWVSAGGVFDDSLDFDKFSDTMTVDAATAIAWGGTTTTGLTVNANSLTSGSALAVASTATGLTGDLGSFVASGSNAGVTGNVLKVGLTGASAVGTALNVTQAGSGAALRVNDDGTYTDTTPFIVEADGDVGIGTTSSGARLSFGTSAGFDGIHLYNDGSYKSGLGITSNTLNLYSGGTSIAFGHSVASGASSMTADMVIVNGNVGIGSASPTEKLDVAGNIKATGTIQVADASSTCTTASDLGKIRFNTSTGKFQICKP